MSLQMNRYKEYEDQGQMHMIKDNETQKEELSLVLEKSFTQSNAMSKELKEARSAQMGSLEDLFHDVLKQKGEADKVQVKKVSEDELEVEGLSNLTLHSFLLKAEELGKNITYTRSLRVRIS